MLKKTCQRAIKHFFIITFFAQCDYWVDQCAIWEEAKVIDNHIWHFMWRCVTHELSFFDVFNHAKFVAFMLHWTQFINCADFLKTIWFFLRIFAIAWHLSTHFYFNNCLQIVKKCFLHYSSYCKNKKQFLWVVWVYNKQPRDKLSLFDFRSYRIISPIFLGRCTFQFAFHGAMPWG